jgi:hypothetical protein
MSLGNACLLKIVEEHPEDLSYLRTQLRGPIWEEENAGTHIGCNSYYYGKRIGMIKKICMTWQR